MNTYTVYVLKSNSANKRYIGITSKTAKERLAEHNSGSNSFTKKNLPWVLIYFEQDFCKGCAVKRERFLKSGQGRLIVDAIEKCTGR